LLKEMKATGERQSGPGDHKAECHDVTPALGDLGISKKQSSDWQKLAGIPEEDFEASLIPSERPTTAGLIREHAEPMPSDGRVAVEAMLLWDALKDFDKVLDMNASSFFP
jgi:hypothetical protein